MKLLVLGGRGMAGHMIVQFFAKKPEWHVYFTTRDPHDEEGLFLDVLNQSRVEELINQLQPDVVINAVGLLNEAASLNQIEAFQINSLLPHTLVKFLDRYGGKLVHISTDCVFSGEKGDYIETDYPDGTTTYAKTKALGEIRSVPHLTIRTSIIGPELKENGIGLFLWFMNQSGKVKGYKKVMWNGVTTLELAKAIDAFLDHNVTGLYHLGPNEKISKYELLKLVQEVFEKRDVRIEPDEAIALDRTIQNTRTDFVYRIPSYKDMLIDLHNWMSQHE